jgi:hypothetical protein
MQLSNASCAALHGHLKGLARESLQSAMMAQWITARHAPERVQFMLSAHRKRHKPHRNKRLTPPLSLSDWQERGGDSRVIAPLATHVIVRLIANLVLVRLR